MKNLIERMYEYYDEMDEDEREYYYHKQKESAPSYDSDAYQDDFNYLERMC